MDKTYKQLEKAEAMHQSMQFAAFKENKEDSISVCTFHNNMMGAVRIEMFRLYPNMFGRLSTLEMQQSIARLKQSGDFN